MATVPEILTAMRGLIATVDGISAVHYPAPWKIVKRREVVLYWGNPSAETVISMDMSSRMWQPAIIAQILTPAEGNTPAEFAEIDNLVTPVVDLLDTAPNHTLGGLVNRCQVTGVRSMLLIEYAGVPHYGAELLFSIKFHRRAGGNP